MAYVPSSELIGFQQERNANDYQYSVGAVQNASSRQQLSLDYQLQNDVLRRNMFNGFQQLPGQYSRRGLLHSGIRNRGYKDFGRQQLDTFAQLDRNFARKGADLAVSMSGLDANRAIQQATIELNQDQRRSALAAIVQGIL